MDKPPFHTRRRQQFLTEELYEKTRANQFDLIEGHQENLRVQKPGTEGHSVSYEMLFLDPLWIWLLDYTAGVPIVELAPRVAGLVDAFEKWNEVHQIYRQALAVEFPEYGTYRYIAGPDFATTADYIDTLQLLSIAIVLRDERSVERIIHVLRSHRGEDGLFEQLIAAYVDDEINMQTCVMGEPYETLLRAFYIENDDLSREAVEQYLKKWYPEMRHHPRWYDGHLHTSKDGSSSYYGYWAFEAAATVFLLNLDDRVIKHMVYPKDLVAYGKQLRAEGRHTSLGSAAAPRTGRCEGGQPCPFAGWWFTPAQADSRRHFAQGEVMPDFKSSWGATIWQFDPEQGEA